MNNYNIKLPDDVQFIIHTLQLHGFEAYAVGDVLEIPSLAENRATGILQHQQCRKRQRHYLTKHLIRELSMER